MALNATFGTQSTQSRSHCYAVVINDLHSSDDASRAEASRLTENLLTRMSQSDEKMRRALTQCHDCGQKRALLLRNALLYGFEKPHLRNMAVDCYSSAVRYARALEVAHDGSSDDPQLTAVLMELTAEVADITQLRRVIDDFCDSIIQGTSQENRALDVVGRVIQCSSPGGNVTAGSELRAEFLRQITQAVGRSRPRAAHHAFVALLHCGLLPAECDRLIDASLKKITEENALALTANWMSVANEMSFKKLLGRLAAFFSAGGDTPGMIDTEIEVVKIVVGRCQHTSKLSRVLVTIFKNRSHDLHASDFLFCILLGLCNCKNYVSEIVAEMKGALMKCWKEEEAIEQCGWLALIMAGKNEYAETLMRVVSNKMTHSDWREVLCIGIHELALSLLDVGTGGKVRIVAGRLQNDAVSVTRSCSTAVQVLLACFSKGSAVATIVQRLMQAVLDNNGKPAALYFIALLAKLLSSTTLYLSKAAEPAKLVLTQCHKLDATVGKPLLRALLPLAHSNPDVRNEMHKACRDALYKSSENSRLIAMHGFLLVLKNMNVQKVLKIDTNNSSQMTQSFPTFSSQSTHSSQSQRHSAIAPVRSSVESSSQRALNASQSSQRGSLPSQSRSDMSRLFVEALACLKRCFTLSKALRVALYNGMLSVSN